MDLTKILICHLHWCVYLSDEKRTLRVSLTSFGMHAVNASCIQDDKATERPCMSNQAFDGKKNPKGARVSKVCAHNRGNLQETSILAWPPCLARISSSFSTLAAMQSSAPSDKAYLPTYLPTYLGSNSVKVVAINLHGQLEGMIS
jgi:hypothetical protein